MNNQFTTNTICNEVARYNSGYTGIERFHEGLLTVLSKEHWKIVVQDPNYWVSSWGRVYNSKTKQQIKGSIHQSNGNQYRRVSLGKRKRHMIHNLQGTAFLMDDYEAIKALEPNARIVLDHIDTNGLNNNILNLKWVTHSDNISAAWGRSINRVFSISTGERKRK